MQRNDKNDDGRRESVCDSRSWVSYLGLNPLEQSSRKSRRLGSIISQGNPFLRYLLVEGAVTTSGETRWNNRK
ncbi:MAG: transposase [Terriglobales bacterium]